MGRRPNAATLCAAPAVLGAVMLALLLPGGGLAFFADPGGSLEPPSSGIRFDQRSRSALVLETAIYRLTIAKKNGSLTELLDRTTGLRTVTRTNGCLWGAVSPSDPGYIGGCLFQSDDTERFSYRWDQASTTLTLTYQADPAGPNPVSAVVTLKAARSYFDLQLDLESRLTHVITSVSFPVDLIEDENLVEAGYGPNFLPGVRFLPGFFKRVGDSVETYPSRWAYADYLALDLGGSHLSLYSVNPSPGPIAPVKLGFVHDDGGPCSNSSFCVVHNFQTWIDPGASWTSPVMRIRVAEPVDETIVGYRSDNGFDSYPTVSDKTGSRLATLVRAPLVKADLEKGTPPFKSWAEALGQLPSPALLHPVAFGQDGFDATNPDVLPPDHRVGTIEEFRAAVKAAHARDQLVMPYLNVSWWNPKSPTVQNLPSPLTPTGVAMQASNGVAVTEQFSGNDGYIVSPSVPYVRQRIEDEFASWQNDVPVDCLFFDQIGARPWRLDFNPAEPTPLAYDDGWLSLMAPYANRCLMVEDGWDRLASSFVGFAGGLMLMQREFDWLDQRYGRNWETFPLALWLFHDKVLLYQHDLYDETTTSDLEMLTWNLAYGFMLSYSWDLKRDTLASPWLGIVAAFQSALGPYYAGVGLTSYRRIADEVTETRFGDFSVVADWSKTVPYSADGYGVAPGGFIARTDGGSVVAGAFSDRFGGSTLSAGTHYLVVERTQAAVTVRQPLGPDTPLVVDPPLGWSSGETLRATALAPDGSAIGQVPGELRDGRFAFTYQANVAARQVGSYSVSAG